MAQTRSFAFRALALAAWLLAAMPSIALAWDLQGSKTLTANTRDNLSIPIGTVRFEPRPDGTVAFAVTMDHARFKDYFLSMKEFKCLDGQVEVFCHVPYPYPQPQTITTQDMAWLEHSLLFLFKLPNEFGAKLWNGVYFRFERTEQGLLGKPQAIDLDRISAPPPKPEIPPFPPALRDDIAPGIRWIESLSIQ